MRTAIFPAIAVGFLMTHGLHAEECATALKETDSYAELSKILGCMYTKIRGLETEVQALRKLRSIPVTAPNDTLADTSDLLQDNAYFSVYKGSSSKSGSTANFTLTIKNKTDKEIYLAWEASTGILTDENGLSTNRLQTTIPSVGRGDSRQAVYAIVGSGAVKPVSMTFIDDRIKGSTLTFGTNIVQLDGDKHYYYSISWRVSLPNK